MSEQWSSNTCFNFLKRKERDICKIWLWRTNIQIYLIDIIYCLLNKLEKLRRHTSWVHFTKIHFGWLHFGKIHFGPKKLGDGATSLQKCKSAKVKKCKSAKVQWSGVGGKWSGSLYLGTFTCTKFDGFSENFRSGGGGVISDPKNYVAFFC